jgi:hypothetical protein
MVFQNVDPTDPLGVDLKLSDDLTINTTGDIQLVSGQFNLQQRIMNRLKTLPDFYYFGDWGSTVKLFVDYVGADLETQVQQSVTAACLSEPTVSTVLYVNVTQSSDNVNAYIIDVAIESISGETVSTQFQLGGGV